MPLRLFITTWSRDGADITNPIRDWIDTNPLSNCWASYRYPQSKPPQFPGQTWQDDASIGAPISPYLIVLVDGPDQTITEIEAINGATLIDPFELKKEISQINNPTKNKINTLLTTMGVNLDINDYLVTDWQTFIYAVIKEIEPEFNGFGAHIEARDLEFA